MMFSVPLSTKKAIPPSFIIRSFCNLKFGLYIYINTEIVCSYFLIYASSGQNSQFEKLTIKPTPFTPYM